MLSLFSFFVLIGAIYCPPEFTYFSHCFHYDLLDSQLNPAASWWDYFHLSILY